MIVKEIINDGNILRLSTNKELPFDMSVGEIIFMKLSENKDLPLQIDGLTDEVDTCGMVLQRSIRTAIKMRSKGVTPDDVVTVCSYNHLNTNIPILASFMIGAKTANIDPNLSPSDTVHLLGLVEPKLIFVSEDGVELVKNAVAKIGCKSEIVVFGETSDHTKFSEFLIESPDEERDFRPLKIENLKETAAIVFSSGTTGLAKGICLNHLSIISQLVCKKGVKSPYNGIISLSYSSPYWISSFILLINTIATNGCRLVLPKFDTESLWYYLNKYKVLFLMLSPTQLATVAVNKKPDNVDTSSLKVLMASGSTIHPEHFKKIQQYLPTTILSSAYGQTEVGGGCLYFELDSDDVKFMSGTTTACGRPQAGYIYKIVDLETEQPVGPNQQGELRIKTDFCMNGYYKQDSSDSWDSDGFIKTGDMAYYDDNYVFYIVDRLKEMLKFQGWQITPAKLESILLSHPDVQSALVIGLPHPIDVDHPTGIVQLRNSAQNITAEEINKYFEKNIDDDKYRLRGGLKILEDIPVTPSGKFKKKYLKELILSGLL